MSQDKRGRPKGASGTTTEHMKDGFREHIARANIIRRGLLGLVSSLDQLPRDTMTEQDLNAALDGWVKTFSPKARALLRNVMALPSKDVVVVDSVDRMPTGW